MTGMQSSVATKRRMRGVLVAAAVLVATAAAGCGEDDYANRSRAAPAIVVSATVSAERVSAAPSRFGAGGIDLIVSNQTTASRRVTLRSQGAPRGGRPLRQSTGPINPGDTASLQARLDEGTYMLATDDRSIEPAEIAVRGRRPSGDDRLLEP